MMNPSQKRTLLFVAGLGSWLMIAFAYFYLEKTLYLNPCPLCMMQRLAFGLIGLSFVIQAIFWPTGKLGLILMKLFKYLSIFFGIGLAARHLYIQSLPAGQAPACGLDFYGLVSQNGWLSGFWRAMQGTGECTTVDLFMGISIPLWAMIAFIIMLFIAIFTDPVKYHDDGYID